MSGSPSSDAIRPEEVQIASSRGRSFSLEVQARVGRLSGVAVTQIGSAGSGVPTHPILACLTADDGDPDRPWVLISAGVHGDEIAGVLAALEFLETRCDELASQFRFAVLPCVNPSGFELGSLETGDGANLNRLFGIGSRQPEIVAVETWLGRSRRRFAATLDLHEIAPDYRGEGFVECDNPHACYLYETQADRTRRIGRSMIEALPRAFEVCRWPFIYEDCNDEGVVSYPEGCRNVVYAQKTTFDAYLHARFTGHSLTLETPMVWRLADRVRAHVVWLEAALTLLSKSGDGGRGITPDWP